MKIEIFRDKVPWLDESLSLVGIQEKKKAHLNLVRLDKSGVEITIHDVCNFDGGEVKFTHVVTEEDRTANDFTMADSEILCLSVMPKGFNIMKMAVILEDPYWQYVLDHFMAAYVMAS